MTIETNISAFSTYTERYTKSDVDEPRDLIVFLNGMAVPVRLHLDPNSSSKVNVHPDGTYSMSSTQFLAATVEFDFFNDEKWDKSPSENDDDIQLLTASRFVIDQVRHLYEGMIETKLLETGTFLDRDMQRRFAGVFFRLHPEFYQHTPDKNILGLFYVMFLSVQYFADTCAKFDKAGKTGLYYEPRLSSGIDTEGVQKALNQRAKEADNKARAVQKKAEKKAKDIALKAEEKKKKEARLAQKKMDHDAKEASLRRVRYNAEPKPKKKYVHTGIGKKNKAIASANSK